LNGGANGADAQSIAVRSNLQKAANQAIGGGLGGPYISRSPMIAGAKADFLASHHNGSEGARSMADLLSSKLEQDEQEERAIQDL